MLIIGHRGAKGLAPEHTRASFQAALDVGADSIEFDVRTTRDGVPVVEHNALVGRQAIARITLKKIKDKSPELLTLDEVLRFLKNRVPVVLEVKSGAAAAPIIQCIEDRLRNGWKLENISISSFDFKLLKTIKAGLPGATIIINEAWSGVRATRRARRLGTKHITMNQKWLWGGFIKSVVRNGFKLTAYTINKPAKARRWQKLGLYAVVTDFPDRYTH